MMWVRGIWVLMLAGIGVAACGEAPQQTRPTFEARADSVVQVLEARDWPRLADFVHPDRGLTFSPYAYVDPQEAVTLPADEVAELGSDTAHYVWGTEDGTGFEIRMTPPEFVEEYIVDADFTSARRGARDEVIGTGNSLNNLPDAFYTEPPGASSNQTITFIEYYLPGTDEYSGMDWASLRLVFEQEEGTWHLIGIVRDRWTI